jgi:hypothetical protein
VLGGDLEASVKRLKDYALLVSVFVGMAFFWWRAAIELGN